MKNEWCLLMLLLVSCAFFLLFLLHPTTVFLGASEGLLLWFHTVLPTLFPFFVITSLLVSSKLIDMVSSYSHLVTLCGFTCGYPMGGKIISDLWNKKCITPAEAQYLLSFCNNASPMFISSYFVIQCLNMPELVLPSIILLFLSPIICSFIFKFYHLSKTSSSIPHVSTPEENKKSGIELFDHAITNSMENIIKIGGYIIFFSILFKFCIQHLNFSAILNYFIIPSLEITNGLKLLSGYNLIFPHKYTLMMAHLSFGGVCSIFQTKCVLKDTPLSLRVYTIEKLITSLVTSLLSYLYITILH